MTKKGETTHCRPKNGLLHRWGMASCLLLAGLTMKMFLAHRGNIFALPCSLLRTHIGFFLEMVENAVIHSHLQPRSLDKCGLSSLFLLVCDEIQDSVRR
mmetsp:Transcript_37387/g.62818  ORF Transcript_37387/g.62818 Transcript_37387/m.62818 type:complete len:99 (+) Transcript_37387:119-415(+)